MSERKLEFFVKLKKDRNLNLMNTVDILSIIFLSDAEIAEKTVFIRTLFNHLSQIPHGKKNSQSKKTNHAGQPNCKDWSDGI